MLKFAVDRMANLSSAFSSHMIRDDQAYGRIERGEIKAMFEAEFSCATGVLQSRCERQEHPDRSRTDLVPH